MARNQVMRTCGTCGQSHLAGAFVGDLCACCHNNKMLVPDTVALTDLKIMGVPPSLRDSQTSCISAPVKAALSCFDACSSVRALIDGAIPTQGFGLSGGVGVGKTSAIVAILKRGSMARAKRHGSGWNTLVHYYPWNSMAERLRAHAVEDETQTLIREMSEVMVLFLDDLGSERIKVADGQDWATKQLYNIIDYRALYYLPTLFTTNLSAPALAHRYGEAMASRLLGTNPLLTITGGYDRRLNDKG